MLVIITTVVKHFELSLPSRGGKEVQIYRKPSVMMMPMAEGQIGAWMGLVLKALN